MNYIKKFGIWEYIFFGMGLLILGKLTYGFLIDTLEYSKLNLIALIFGVLAISMPVILSNLMKSLFLAIIGIIKKITKL